MLWNQFGKIRRQRLETLQLTSLLSRWCQVRENLLYAFEKCLDSSLSTPLKQAIRDLLTRMRGGMVPDDALKLFAKHSDCEHFQDLVFALRFNFRHRGNLPALLELLEIQQNKLEEAYHDRQISNQMDLRVAGGLLAAVPLLFFLRFLANSSISTLFLQHVMGVGLLLGGAVSYTLAVAWYFKIQRQIRT
ncbi:MAG: hypothetical protein PHC86_08415 [Eubacteriales bacterium]|nr:hypothetical protein [Eubacteriales bacterium]